jgi:hypothetical protein
MRTERLPDSAEVLVGPWAPIDADNRRRLDVRVERQRMAASPGHRPDTGVSTPLVRVPVLSPAESLVVAELLGVLADSKDGEVAGLAADMASRIRSRLSI